MPAKSSQPLLSCPRFTLAPVPSGTLSSPCFIRGEVIGVHVNSRGPAFLRAQLGGALPSEFALWSSRFSDLYQCLSQFTMGECTRR